MTDLLLVVEQRSTSLEVDGKSLVLRTAGCPPRRVPLRSLSQVILATNCQADTRVWRTLAECDIATVMLPGRGKGASALVGAGLGVGRRYRHAQHRIGQNAQYRVAADIVGTKIATYIELSKIYFPQEPNFPEALPTPPPLAAESLDLDTLRGWEGAAARHWYQTLARRLPEKWGFKKRVRRPPTDPFNALLSLGYTLLAGVANQAVAGIGLDPAQGILHQPYPGRAACVLDVMEAFRAGIDHMTLALLPTLTPEDFTHSDQEGTRLAKSRRGHFFKQWALYCADWPFCLAEITGTYRAADNSLLANLLRHTQTLGHQLLAEGDECG